MATKTLTFTTSTQYQHAKTPTIGNVHLNENKKPGLHIHHLSDHLFIRHYYAERIRTG